MSPPSPASEIATPSAGCFEAESLSISLEPMQTPAAFVDRAARILHANSSFYALLQNADLGEANWIAAFDEPERLSALIHSVHDSHALLMTRVDHGGRKLTIWAVASANAYPMAGRQDTIRLISLHCGPEAMRLHLALRPECDNGDAGRAYSGALMRHLNLLSSAPPRRDDGAAAANPTRLLLNALAAQTQSGTAGSEEGAT